MGYKMPIVCKQLVIPVEDTGESLTLQQYKEKYGIDLSQYIVLNEGVGGIEFHFPPNTLVILDEINYPNMYGVRCGDINFVNVQNYQSGSSDGITTLGHGEMNQSFSFGLTATILKSKDFTLKNIELSYLTI